MARISLIMINLTKNVQLKNRAVFMLILLGLVGFPYAAMADTPVNTTSIGDYVWNDFNRNGIQDNYERGVKEVAVGLYQKGADNIFNTEDDELIDHTYTDNNGEYLFENVVPGEYALKLLDFSLPDGFIVCPKGMGNNPDRDSDFDPETLMSEAFVVGLQENNHSFDGGLMNPCAGFIPNLTIGYGQIVPAGGSPETLTILSPNIAHPEDYEFQWMRKTAYTDWMPILGANEMTYTPPAVFSHTYYVLCYRLADCPDSDYKDSNVILVEIGNCIAPIETESFDFCVDEPVIFTSGNNSINLTFSWSAEGGVVSSASGNSTSVTWFAPGDYYVELTSTSANGCTHTTRRLVHVTECNDYACCENGQLLTTLCYSAGTGSGTALCSVQVPCNITDDLIATGQFFCGPCLGTPSCGTGFFLNSLEDPTVALDESREAIYEVMNHTNEEGVTFQIDRDVNVFPNPANERITFAVDTKHIQNRSSKILVQLVDMQSIVHEEMYIQNTTDVEQVVFDLGNLGDGLYMFRVINGQEAPQIKKFVKIRK